MSENWNGISGLKFLKTPYTGENSELWYDFPYGTHAASIDEIKCSYNDATGKGHIDIDFQISGITEDVSEIERVYSSFINEYGKTGHTYDNIWWNWYEIFEEYVLTHDKLPTIKTYYNGMKLGYWFNRQKERARAGLLDDIRINAINSVYPGKWY